MLTISGESDGDCLLMTNQLSCASHSCNNSLICRPLMVICRHLALCFAAESRIGRQPNAIKHATFLQLCQIKSAKGIASSCDPFAVSESMLTLTEAGDSGTTAVMASDSSDFTVTTSHNGRLLTDGRKKPRRPYRRRSLKANPATSDNSNPSHNADSTQPCLSPIEIKQEVASPLECDTNDLLDQLGVSLGEDLSSCGQQRLTETQPEHVSHQASGMHTGNTDGSECCCCTEQLSTGDCQAISSNSAVPRPCPGVPVPQPDSIDAALPGRASSLAPQPNYEDVVKSMQRAYYDLLPILCRVCLSALSSVHYSNM